MKGPALALIQEVAPHLAALSPHFHAGPRSLFRIHRDVRFSKDKSPYKTSVGVQFRHDAGRDSHAPGFYLHVEPGKSFVGLGMWHPDGPALRKVRERIVEKPGSWRAAMGDRRFRDAFELEGDRLERPPRGFDPEHPLIEALKWKDYIRCPAGDGGLRHRLSTPRSTREPVQGGYTFHALLMQGGGRFVLTGPLHQIACVWRIAPLLWRDPRCPERSQEAQVSSSPKDLAATGLALSITVSLIAAPVAAQSSSPVGVWDVVEWVNWSPEGERREALGSDPNAMFVYTPGGNLILHATTDPLIAPQATPPSTEDLALRASSTVAYYGTYTVDLEKSEIVHHIQGDLLPNRAGRSVARAFRIEDGELILDWMNQDGSRFYRRLRRLEAF